MRTTRAAALAALADGTLSGPRRAMLAARVDDSRRLRVLLAEQHRALRALRALEAERAPPALRERIRAPG